MTSSSPPGIKGQGVGEMRGFGGRGLAYKDFNGGSREGRERKREDQKRVGEEVGRQRGVFTFALAGEEVLSHPPFYSATSDPWTMRLERAPPVPEPAN